MQFLYANCTTIKLGRGKSKWEQKKIEALAYSNGIIFQLDFEGVYPLKILGHLGNTCLKLSLDKCQFQRRQ